jgi:hypothetical protein
MCCSHGREGKNLICVNDCYGVKHLRTKGGGSQHAPFWLTIRECASFTV